MHWDPKKYNNIKKLHIPSDAIWIPDILLWNMADGEPHITIMSDAIVYYTGLVVWKPPSIYKSFCPVILNFSLILKKIKILTKKNLLNFFKLFVLKLKGKLLMTFLIF